jgi:hypothetical protein
MAAPTHKNREALARAEFFLHLARQCVISDRAEHEAFLEAAIVFARAVLHRLNSEYRHREGWKPWWEAFRAEPAVEFFRYHRDFILKEGSARANQIINFNPITLAEDLYYFDDPSIPAAATVETHLRSIAVLVERTISRFDGHA